MIVHTDQPSNIENPGHSSAAPTPHTSFNIQAIGGGAMDGRQGYRFNSRGANPIFVGIPFDSAGPGTGWRLNDQCPMVSLGLGNTFGSTTWGNGDSFVTIAKTQPNGYAPFV